MLRCGDDMNKIKVITEQFSFLVDFKFSYKQQNSGYECTFEKGNINILLTESGDYRDEYRIDFVIKKGTKILFTFYYEPMVNCSLAGVEQMSTSVNSIYLSAKHSRKGFTKIDFLKVIQLYAEFVEANLYQIMNN